MSAARAIADRAPVGPLGKLALGAEIVGTYGEVRWALRGAQLPEALAMLRAPATRRPTGDALVTGRRLGHAVTRTLAVLPTDTRCLMRSLVLTRLLARRGIETRLVIAVQPGERFAAHAWVEHDGVPLLPAGAFEQLVAL